MNNILIEAVKGVIFPLLAMLVIAGGFKFFLNLFVIERIKEKLKGRKKKKTDIIFPFVILVIGTFIFLIIIQKPLKQLLQPKIQPKFAQKEEDQKKIEKRNYYRPSPKENPKVKIKVIASGTVEKIYCWKDREGKTHYSNVGYPGKGYFKICKKTRKW